MDKLKLWEYIQMYKIETTSYLVRDIPVSVWKKVRAKAVRMDTTMQKVIIDALHRWSKRKDWLDE